LLYLGHIAVVNENLLSTGRTWLNKGEEEKKQHYANIFSTGQQSKRYVNDLSMYSLAMVKPSHLAICWRVTSIAALCSPKRSKHHLVNESVTISSEIVPLHFCNYVIYLTLARLPESEEKYPL
jgi:hypothetical protein